MEKTKMQAISSSQVKLLKNLKKIENVKTSLSKIMNFSSRTSPAQTPIQQPNTAERKQLQIQTSRLRNFSPSQIIENLGQNLRVSQPSGRCKECVKLEAMMKKQNSQKIKTQWQLKGMKELLSISKQQNEGLSKKIDVLNRTIKEISDAMLPYQNNVNIMEQTLESIKSSLKMPIATFNNLQIEKYEKSFDEKQKTLANEFDFLRKTHERDQSNNDIKIDRLNFMIGHMEKKNKELKSQNEELQRTIKVMNGIINDSGYFMQQKELFYMASEEAYQLKVEYYRLRDETISMSKLIEKLKNKIYMLTSLIGYGVVSSADKNDLHQITQFKDNLYQVDLLNERQSYDVYSLQGLKSYDSCYDEVKSLALNDQVHSCLYRPSFLFFFENSQIKTALEENVTTIIKPEFFLFARAILDSKYNEFLLKRENASSFPDFVYSFIELFRIRRNEKRIDLNSKMYLEDHEMIKISFIIRMFDHKIGELPEIVTFREFLMKNTPKDQIFYYLMCRNLILNGSELSNYINCSDSYNFVPYETVKNCMLELLEGYDKNSKTLIFNHINQKKIMKNKKLLLKTGYVLRILLEVYRKFKREKLSKLRNLFEQTCRLTKSQVLKFHHFEDILLKNFDFLTSCQVCDLYRKSISIYQTQKNQTPFFQCFNASSIDIIFLIENLRRDAALKHKCHENQQARVCNYLMELVPDSVVQLGNQSLYYEYIGFVKMKSIGNEERIKMAQFLLNIAFSRIESVRKRPSQLREIEQTIDKLNNKLIDWINYNLKQRQKYEQGLEDASSLIGKHMKRKIYEFYSQFIKDINKEVEVEDPRSKKNYDS